MKFALTLFGVLIFFQATSAVFFGANIVLPQSAAMTATINKYLTLADKVAVNINKVIVTSNRLENEVFDASTLALTDITYLIENVEVFSSTFLSRLNNQTKTQTAQNSVSNIASLVYQLEVYIVNALPEKFAGAGPALGAAYGQIVQDNIVAISNELLNEFTQVDGYLRSLIFDNLQPVVQAKAEITAADISANNLNGLVTSFNDIYVTLQKFDALISRLVVVTTTLDKVISQTLTAQKNTSTAIARGSFGVDLAVQSAIIMNSKNFLLFQSKVTQAFDTWKSLAGKLFSGDAEVLGYRAEVDTLVVNLLNYVENNVATKFTIIFSNFYVQLSIAIKDLQTQVDANTQKIIDYFDSLAATSSNVIVKCVGPSALSMATKIVQTMGQDSAKCLKVQEDFALSQQSLINFIAEDVIINMQGVADTLCGCSVGGSTVDKNKSKKCIKSVVAELPLVFANDQTYLAEEANNLVDNADVSQQKFLECAGDVTNTFDASFQSLQETVNACLAAGR